MRVDSPTRGDRATRRHRVILGGIAAPVLAGLSLLVPACSPGLYRADADRVAYRIIEEKQRQALGRTEPFTIDSAESQLRRRLLLDQHLPMASPASLGARYIDAIAQWPDPEYLARAPHEPESQPSTQPGRAPALRITLVDALHIAAANSREYQSQKEAVFQTALQLDLERNSFRTTWASTLSTLFQSDLQQLVALDDKGHTDLQTISGLEYGPAADVTQRLRNGLSATGNIGLDLVSLLTQRRVFSRGIVADVSATLPLLRGSGEFVVTEPLTQAERNVIYAIFQFQRFKRTFAVAIASEYLDVLQQFDQVANAESNYRNLIASTRRARRLADAGRLPEIQVDQSRQDELNSRQRWIAAQQSVRRSLDAFKLTLGIPVDARIELDPAELLSISRRMNTILQQPPADPDAAEKPTTSAPGAHAPITLTPPGTGQPGPYEYDEDDALGTALERRLDLRVAIGRVFDAQRVVAVAADQLRADVTLLGTGSAGARRTLASAAEENAILRPDEGSYSALLTVDLPIERTAERNVYRGSLIDLEQAVRDAQEVEDQVKLDVRNRLSELLEARESVQIQAEAVEVARRRVDSTNLFLEAGRAEIRDVLEAQQALLSAQNALTAALVNYRVGELALQRDMDVLEVSPTGLWTEYVPPGGTRSPQPTSRPIREHSQPGGGP